MKKLILIFLAVASPLFAQNTKPVVIAPELNTTVSPFDTTGLKLYAVALDSAIVELQQQATALAALAKLHREKAMLLKRKRTHVIGLVKSERKR